MKVAKITGERQCEIAERPDPKATDEFVIVKIKVAPMCTEWKAYSSGHMFHPLGHEAVGEVVETAQEGNVEVGDRVLVLPLYPCGKCSFCLTGEYIYCRNVRNMIEVAGSEWGTDTYAQYILKQDWMLFPVPDDLSDEHASMANCGLGPSFGGMQLTNVNRFDTVIIAGLGPVGLGGVINAVYRGARVIGVDSNSYRAKLAEGLGASVVINPEDADAVDQVHSLTGGHGADKAIECSGVGAAVTFCLQATCRKGRVALVGGSGDFSANGWLDIVSKGLIVYGSWNWNGGDFPLIYETIRGSSALIDKMITHTFPLDRITDAWEQQITGECGKILLHP